MSMKRARPLATARTQFAGFFNNVSDDQLKWIGAVAIRWNSIEDGLDWAVCWGLGVDHEMLTEVAPRLGGIDSKLDIWRAIAKQHNWPEHGLKTLEKLILAVKEHAEYRNAVVHSNPSDAPNAVGALRRRGKLHDVSLRADVLEVLFERIEAINSALGLIFQVTHWVRGTRGPKYENGTLFMVPASWFGECDTKIAEADNLLDNLPGFPADIWGSL